MLTLHRPINLAAAVALALSLGTLLGCVHDEVKPGAPAAAAPQNAPAKTATHAANDDGSASGGGTSAAENRPADTASEKTAEAGDASTTTEALNDQQAVFTPLAAKVKFKTDGGATIISFKAASDGAKAIDGDDSEFARFNVRTARVKVKKPDDSEAGNIRITATRLKIENPQDEKLFELQRQDDGDWKLDDANEKLVYRIKKREYGYEIEDANEESLYKIKLKDGKLSIRDAGDKTVMATKDPFPPLAAAALVLDQIQDAPLRYGIAVAFALEVDGLKP